MLFRVITHLFLETTACDNRFYFTCINNIPFHFSIFDISRAHHCSSRAWRRRATDRQKQFKMHLSGANAFSLRQQTVPTGVYSLIFSYFCLCIYLVEFNLRSTKSGRRRPFPLLFSLHPSMHRSWAGLFLPLHQHHFPLSPQISSTIVAVGRLDDLIWTRTFSFASFHGSHHGDVRDGNNICHGFKDLGGMKDMRSGWLGYDGI